jgi:hypothetical protein
VSVGQAILSRQTTFGSRRSSLFTFVAKAQIVQVQKSLLQET